ncbi:MAG: O-methyltransferase [Isosphaeraceae bacterium]
MSGAMVPYHIRPNKYVERQLFIELLSHVDKVVPIVDYLYVSMGGRLLEDFKLLHGRLNLLKMMSIECDEVTYQGQLFNCPMGHIDCRRMKSAELIEDFDSLLSKYEAANTVVWLDYADPKHRGQQLSEFSTLVSKLGSYDIAKITLNASLRTLVATGGEAEQHADETAQERGLRKLKGQLGDFLDKALTPSDLNASYLPIILADSIGRAALQGIASDRSNFVEPLAAFVYNDGHHNMLTVASIVLPYHRAAQATAEDEADQAARARLTWESFRRETRLERWPFLANDWQDVKRIRIPDLSMKERFWIHDCMKTEGRQLDVTNNPPPFRIGDDTEDITAEAIEMYTQFHRYYPNFLPVVL